MKARQTSRTAQYMAFFRALETKRPASQRLFKDVYAINFLDIGLKLAVKIYGITGSTRKLVTNIIQKKIPGALSSGIARTKYIDELLQKAINNGAKQVLILGAGFDTRALRLDFLKTIPVIEIDHPNTSNFKQTVFKQRVGELPKNVTYCQIDFNTQSLDELAEKHAFDFTLPTTVIWEGVTNYLTADAVSSTFKFVSRFANSSFVIFTYVHQNVLINPSLFLGGEKLLADLDEIEERWTFGLQPNHVAEYLQQFGFTVLEDLGADDYRNKYLPNRTEKGYEFYRIAFAKKANV